MHNKTVGRNRRREILAQKARELFGYKPSVFEACYDAPQAIFIHIPKCAGTSVAYALYGRSCWHWTAEDLRFINRKKFESYRKFSIVRNPWARLYSAFNYAPNDLKRFNHSPLGVVAQFETFETFVMNGLTKEIASKHYFLGQQVNHVMLDGRLVDEICIGRFEEFGNFTSTLTTDFPQLANVPQLNPSPKQAPLEEAYSRQMIEKVGDFYHRDIDAFGYSFPSNNR